MKRLAAALAVLAALPGMARRPPKDEAAARAMTAGVEKMEWSGAFCPVGERKTVEVTSAEQWTELWTKTLGQAEVPKADFGRQFAVAVFVGSVPTGGYGVEFLEPVVEGGRATVRYKIVKPDSGGFAIQAFTQPYAVRLYNKVGLPVRVRESA